jgi:hypothetical protein
MRKVYSHFSCFLTSVKVWCAKCFHTLVNVHRIRSGPVLRQARDVESTDRNIRFHAAYKYFVMLEFSVVYVNRKCADVDGQSRRRI